MNEMSLRTLGKMISFVASVAMFLVAIGVGSKLTCGSVETKWMLIKFTRVRINERCAIFYET